MKAFLVVILSILVAFFVSGCDDGEEEEIEGDDAGECSDEADNDRDGLFDCDDDDCHDSPACDGADGDADSDSDADRDADADADTDSDADADVDADPCIEGSCNARCIDEGNVGGYCNGDECVCVSGADGDADSDIDADVDSDADTDTDADGDDDGGPVESHAVLLTDTGVAQRISLPPTLAPALGTNYTAELWFYWDGSTPGNARLFSLLSDTSRMAFILHISDGSLDAIVDNGDLESRTETRCGTAVAHDEWHHAALVVRSDSVDIFLDGELSCSESMVATLVELPSLRISVGARFDGYLPDSFFGVIDEIRFSTGSVYSESFSPERRLSVTPSTVGFWHIDESTGSTLSDDSDLSGDARLEGGCLVDQEFDRMPDGSECACVPECGERVCGTDPVCGELGCGSCEPDEFCTVLGSCECEFEECGGTCCSIGEVCDEGTCCSPMCPEDRECGGDDGCGGDCPGCPVEDDTWCYYGSCLPYGWTELFPDESPTGRTSAGFASGGGRTLLFGGQRLDVAVDDETWEWTGETWVLLTPSSSPSPRSGCGLVYLESSGSFLLFGGKNGAVHYDDTWEFDGEDWTEIHPDTSPSPRYTQEMVYDSLREVVVLFGGYDGRHQGDTWEWNGETWSEAATDGPLRSSGSSMAFDPERGVTVLFQSTTATTWEWDGTTWTHVETGFDPTPRGYSEMAYDTERGVAILFGGRSGDIWPNDTWERAGIEWSLIVSEESPRGRSVPALDFEEISGNVLMLGGVNDGVELADTWVYRGAGTGSECGDGVCAHGETTLSCEVDCPAVCGDGLCTHDEDASTCSSDCHAICGDGACTHDETAGVCPVDCPLECGDDICSDDETARSCPEDCPGVCGDDLCTHDETGSSCPDDCPPVCGDDMCTHDENAGDCPDDCPVRCGDGFCTHGEDWSSCPADCDSCFGVSPEGRCVSLSTREFCLVPTGEGHPELVRYDCGEDSECVELASGAVCRLTTLCRSGTSECSGDFRQLRTCVEGAWVTRTCSTGCIPSAVGGICPPDVPVRRISGHLSYEVRGPNADFSDWSSGEPFVASAPGFTVLSIHDGEYVDVWRTDETRISAGHFNVFVSAVPDDTDFICFSTFATWLDGSVAYGVFDPGFGVPGRYHVLETISTTLEPEPWAWCWPLPGLFDGVELVIREESLSGVARVFDYLRYSFRVAEDSWSREDTPDPLAVWIGSGIEWSCGVCAGPLETTAFGIGFGSQIWIPAGADARYWSDPVTAHELGHWVMSSFGRTPGEGGPHCVGVCTYPGQAWSEGWATWFSSDIRENPIYYDKQEGSMFWFDISERDYSSPRSWLLPVAEAGLEQMIDENEVSAMLWHLSDGLGYGRTPLHNALSSERMTGPDFARGYTRHTWGMDGCSAIDILATDDPAPHLADFLDALVCDGMDPAHVDAVTQPETRYPYPSDRPFCE